MMRELPHTICERSVERIGPRPVLDRIAATVDERAGWLERELG